MLTTAAAIMRPDDTREKLEKRLGRLHARQRLGIEMDHEAQVFGQGLRFIHIENLFFSHVLIEAVLKLSGLYWRGRRNAAKLRLKHNDIVSYRVPRPFDGFRILHLSDLHIDMSEEAMRLVLNLLPGIDYDLCVLTGDYRGKTFGSFDPVLAGMARLREALGGPVYGVLGNHDSIRMVPGLEGMGIRMLLNECVTIERGAQKIHLAGIDDAHFYRVDNIEKAADAIPHEDFSILLSHTPEIYRQAAHAGFDFLLSGHTHGGQICLPGGIPITLDAAMPRSFGAGAWKYGNMAGYTSTGAGSSVVPVRFNCPPEITLHTLRSPPQDRPSIRAVPDVEPV
ncbi:MAG: metallophosphoesterase [Beijerinckiaceae bacterium]|nr:metallophosphoesterase [Beijerinckiaceae bacterium]MCI0736822.1 metallophosphoesterase [Beijerinckiaceae bacterium]